METIRYLQYGVVRGGPVIRFYILLPHTSTTNGCEEVSRHLSPSHLPAPLGNIDEVPYLFYYQSPSSTKLRPVRMSFGRRRAASINPNLILRRKILPRRDNKWHQLGLTASLNSTIFVSVRPAIKQKGHRKGRSSRGSEINNHNWRTGHTVGVSLS